MSLIINVSIVFSLFIVSFVIGVDVDYVNDNSLRTDEENACYSGLYKLYCKIKCGMKSNLCIDKHCYCVFAVDSKKKTDGPQIVYLAKPDEPVKEINLDFDDYQHIGRNDDNERQLEAESFALDQSMLSSRPALRHHIAHFCPNLEVARTCIRTCMKEGKPAFCGKDHVCYCGHKYSSNDNNTAVNLEETYGQFRDLYEKYFGPASHGGHKKKML